MSDSRTVELLLIVITLEEEGISLRSFSAMRRLPSERATEAVHRVVDQLVRLASPASWVEP